MHPVTFPQILSWIECLTGGSLEVVQKGTGGSLEVVQKGTGGSLEVVQKGTVLDPSLLGAASESYSPRDKFTPWLPSCQFLNHLEKGHCNVEP